MDEVLFRSAQKVENLQIQAELAATKAKDVLVVYLQQSKVLLSNIWNSALLVNIRQIAREDALKFNDLRLSFAEKFNPKEIYELFVNILSRKWTKRDLYFGCSGLIIGCGVGILIGLTIRKRGLQVRYMEAVQCRDYSGIESVTVVEDAPAPYECRENEVLVNVKAASVQVIDTMICSGYGRSYRRILRWLNEGAPSDLPVTLGRDCSGVVVDVGHRVKRLEIGDEVWLTVPFWAQGTLSQTVLVPEDRIARKPKNIGFEGACSIPYAGSMALSALSQAQLDYNNVQDRNILVLGGCTPVGCVLIQILTHWGALVTATCYKRALPVVKALGAQLVLIQEEDEGGNLVKQLESENQTFDVVITTTDAPEGVGGVLGENGTLVTTVPGVLLSDSCWGPIRWGLHWYIWLRYRLQNAIGLPMGTIDETHLCYINLDKLAELVEDGHIQTVVDKVYQPRDIREALGHIRSTKSIGSTIITFR